MSLCRGADGRCGAHPPQRGAMQPRGGGTGGGQKVPGDADTHLHPFLDGPGGVSAGLGAEAARGAQGGGEGVSKPEGEPDHWGRGHPSVPSPVGRCGSTHPRSLLQEGMWHVAKAVAHRGCCHRAGAGCPIASSKLSFLVPCPLVSPRVALCREGGSGAVFSSQHVRQESGAQGAPMSPSALIWDVLVPSDAVGRRGWMVEGVLLHIMGGWHTWRVGTTNLRPFPSPFPPYRTPPTATTA